MCKKTIDKKFGGYNNYVVLYAFTKKVSNLINCIIFDIYILSKYDNIGMNPPFSGIGGKFKIDKTIYIYCKFFYKGMRRYFRSLRVLISLLSFK